MEAQAVLRVLQAAMREMTGERLVQRLEEYLKELDIELRNFERERDFERKAEHGLEAFRVVERLSDEAPFRRFEAAYKDFERAVSDMYDQLEPFAS
jgi:hypothetical protein